MDSNLHLAVKFVPSPDRFNGLDFPELTECPCQGPGVGPAILKGLHFFCFGDVLFFGASFITLSYVYILALFCFISENLVVLM